MSNCFFEYVRNELAGNQEERPLTGLYAERAVCVIFAALLVAAGFPGQTRPGGFHPPGQAESLCGKGRIQPPGGRGILHGEQVYEQIKPESIRASAWRGIIPEI